MSPAAPPGPAVAGVVLAAGRSSRMGRPKALLPVDGVPFVERAVATLREGGCDPVVAVVGPGGEAIAEAAERGGARTVVNPDSEAEQVESLARGLAAIPPGPAAAVVLPVDVPLAGPAVVRTLIAAFRARGAPIVRTYECLQRLHEQVEHLTATVRVPHADHFCEVISPCLRPVKVRRKQISNLGRAMLVEVG